MELRMHTAAGPYERLGEHVNPSRIGARGSHPFYLCWCPDSGEPMVLEWIDDQFTESSTGYAPLVSDFAAIYPPEVARGGWPELPEEAP